MAQDAVVGASSDQPNTHLIRRILKYAALGAVALVGLRFVDNHGRIAERYPANPNGSPAGIAGLASEDGRVTITMPHPERVFRTVQCSWHPADWGECSPWQQLFDNARLWVDGTVGLS